jgi:PAS domain S-box-containing protein
MIGRAMKRGSHFFEWLHQRVNGQIFDASVLLTKMEVDGNMMLQATVRDISERKKIEKELKKSEERYQSLLVNMRSGVAVYRVDGKCDNFFFKDFNEAAETMEGLKKKDILGKEVRKVFPGAGGMGIVDIFKKVCAKNKPEYLSEAKIKNLKQH